MNMNNETRRNLAVEELKILSSIIGRIESTIHHRLAWLLTLITALGLSLLKNEPFITAKQYALISILVTVGFWVVDAIQRVPVHRAVLRSKQVEKALREDEGFDSPSITSSLSDNHTRMEEFKIAFRWRVISPYLAICLVILIILLSR
jgi:lipopolysaccharide export LptBFGC system permease protein LptF